MPTLPILDDVAGDSVKRKEFLAAVATVAPEQLAEVTALIRDFTETVDSISEDIRASKSIRDQLAKAPIAGDLQSLLKSRANLTAAIEQATTGLNRHRQVSKELASLNFSVPSISSLQTQLDDIVKQEGML